MCVDDHLPRPIFDSSPPLFDFVVVLGVAAAARAIIIFVDVVGIWGWPNCSKRRWWWRSAARCTRRVRWHRWPMPIRNWFVRCRFHTVARWRVYYALMTVPNRRTEKRLWLRQLWLLWPPLLLLLVFVVTETTKKYTMQYGRINFHLLLLAHWLAGRYNPMSQSRAKTHTNTRTQFDTIIKDLQKSRFSFRVLMQFRNGLFFYQREYSTADGIHAQSRKFQLWRKTRTLGLAPIKNILNQCCTLYG